MSDPRRSWHADEPDWPELRPEDVVLLYIATACQCRSPLIPCPVHPDAVKGTPLPGLEDLE